MPALDRLGPTINLGLKCKLLLWIILGDHWYKDSQTLPMQSISFVKKFAYSGILIQASLDYKADNFIFPTEQLIHSKEPHGLALWVIFFHFLFFITVTLYFFLAL